ncbi:hypothetical protein GCM10009610_06870 [Pseudonocardia xinjiangensis]
MTEPSGVDLLGQRPHLLRIRLNDGPRYDEVTVPGGARRRFSAEVAGQHQYAHAVARQRGLHRDALHAGQLLRAGDHLAVHAALGEQLLRMGLLEVAHPDLRRGDVRGDRQHRSAATGRVVQALHQVRVARPAAARAGCQPPRELGLGGRRERRGLLVVHMHPLHVRMTPDRVRHRIQAVTDQPVDAPHSRLDEDLDHLVGNRGSHGFSSSQGHSSSYLNV